MNNTYRIFSLVAYDDSDNLLYTDLYPIVSKLDCTYFIIKHDKDENKTHYHISLCFKKPTTLNVVSKKLQVPENYIKIKDDFGKRYTLKTTIGYLIHYNNGDKHNYNIDDIITNNKDVVMKYYDILSGGNSESQELKEIMLFLENNRANRKDLLMFCLENNLLKTFRKYSYFLNQIIQENIVERSL